jgi:DNA processing protein
LTQSNDFHKLQLIRSPNIGPVTYRQLLARFGDAAAALAALPDLAGRGGGRKFTVASPRVIEQELETAHRANARYVFLGDPAYPELLTHLDNAPAAFTYRGDLALLARPVVAMVGARNASAGACRMARTLAHDLGNLDFTVVSGLARGIDTAAHVGSLQTGTIAIIAGGIDVAYPPENAELQNAIADKGLLIAEMQPGIEPRARHFPYRNRIIAGLALGTVVVEAAPKSGSLITARLAAEAGREVMAIPGSPIDPRARGCNQLIREGATLVQDAQEIAELLSPLDYRATRQAFMEPSAIEPVFEAGDGERKAVIDLLGMTGVGVDELVRQSGLGTPVVQMVLLELELAGRLERGAGATVKLSA